MRSSIFALMLLAFAAYCAACGDGGDGGDDVDSTLEQALASITDSQLAVMPLIPEELSEAFDLQFYDDGAEAIDNAEAAANHTEEDDTAADQERAGRINGYERRYVASGGHECEGEREVTTVVWLDLYQEAASASAAQAELEEPLKALEGQPAIPNERDFEVDTFAVDGLTSETTGIHLRPLLESVDFPCDEGHGWSVIFTYGRLLILISQTRYDDTDVASQVEDAAQAQIERIEGVLKGEIAGTPEPAAPPSPPPARTGPTGFEALTPGTQVGFEASDQSETSELLFTGLRIEAVDFDLERIDFALIGPYSGPLPRDLKIVDNFEGVCQVLQVTSPAGETELNLIAGEELIFTLEYACEEGRAVKFVGLFGLIFERP